MTTHWENHVFVALVRLEKGSTSFGRGRGTFQVPGFMEPSKRCIRADALAPCSAGSGFWLNRIERESPACRW
jgi:hypothetical protein